MRIDSSTIGMESARSYRASNVTVRRFSITEYQAGLTTGDNAGDGNALNAAISNGENGSEEETRQTTESGKTTLQEWQTRFQASASCINIRSTASDTVTEIRQMTIRYIFELLFSSRKERLKDLVEESGWSDMGSSQNDNAAVSEGTQVTPNLNEGKLVDNGMFFTNMKVLSYQQETIHVETENTSFSTVGTVRTKDGREINFNVNVEMSREFQAYYREDLEIASFKMCDPLVINLDTDVAELSDQNFYFDIDADGEADEIATLSGKSGYLALDKNGDGVINDGKELFGTESGNGFADLAAYDEDGNGWIDEGDAVWSKLKIWCKDENGEDVLYRLADKEVGAICLQNAATDFTLKGADGHTKGAIRNSGVFLYENGNVGTIQHVDVAKYQMQA